MLLMDPNDHYMHNTIFQQLRFDYRYTSKAIPFLTGTFLTIVNPCLNKSSHLRNAECWFDSWRCTLTGDMIRESKDGME